MIRDNVYVCMYVYVSLCFGTDADRFSAVLAVKHDCVFGDDLELNEISYVSEVFCSFLSLLPYSLPLSFSYEQMLIIFCQRSFSKLICDTSCQVLSKLNRPIVYSLSPGTSVTPAMAKDVSGLVNMYRITGDDWDYWADVRAHFDVTR